MPSPKALLQDFEAFAKKRFGQHFLASPGVIDNIIAAAQIQEGEQILEVGPGLGALTDGLLRLQNPYKAFEIDTDMIRFLRHRYPEMDIYEGDAASVDWSTVIEGTWVCVSNLPYNVGTSIVTNMLKAEGRFSRLIVMLQQEVAQRMLAPAGDRKRGSLSVFCQIYADVRSVLFVPPGAFYPPPKVDSRVISLTPRLHPSCLDYPVSVAFVERLVKQGFTMPRKTLHNNLKNHYPIECLSEALERALLNPKQRPSTLTVTDWVLLGHTLEELISIG